MLLKRKKALAKPRGKNRNSIVERIQGTIRERIKVMRAFRKMFYSNKIGGLTVEHKIQNYQTTRIHNYRIETVFMKIKDRVLDFRGLKALWSAPILMNAIVIQHNFIENHSTTDEVPSERAGQNLNLGENRWLGLIRNSALQNNN